MINLKKPIFLLICLFELISTPIALCAAQSTIYVSGDNTGDYKCDGNNDQIQINQALNYAAKHPGTTVYLKGPFVYDIRSICLIGSNTELTGDSSSKLRLHNSNGWTTPSTSNYIIGQIGGSGSMVHDIKIHGFEIDGNEGAQSGVGGKDLYRLISFRGSSNAPVSNIRVYNMNLHDAKGEGFRCTFGKNIYYYNNIGANLQHTCVMYSRVNTGEIHDNVAHQCSCAADRLDNCQNIAIYNENISPYSGTTTYPRNKKGYAVSDIGVYVANSDSSPATSNIVVHNCNIMSGVDGVLFDCLNDNSKVNFYNNAIHDSGYEHEAVSRNGGLGITKCGNGITIQNNDITRSDVAGINVDSAIKGTRTVTVANNDIMNGKTGYGIKNKVYSNVKLDLTHNYLYKNPIDYYPTKPLIPKQATSPNTNFGADEDQVSPHSPIESLSEYLKNIYAPFSVHFTDEYQNTFGWERFSGDIADSTDQDPVYAYAGKETSPLI
jgi:hypothetical protein